MTRTSKAIGTLAALTTMGAALLTLQPAQADDSGHAGRSYVQTNLVSDVPGLAKVTDPNLKNPWGTSTRPGSPHLGGRQQRGGNHPVRRNRPADRPSSQAARECRFHPGCADRDRV